MSDAANVLLEKVDVSWTVTLVTFGLLVGLLFLRRLLPPDRRKRGRMALVFLAMSVLVSLGAAGAAYLDDDSAVRIMGFVALILMAFGATGVVAVLVFDILLGRFRVSVPELVRDLLQGIAFVIITLAVLKTAGVDPTGLITGSAVLTAIIGLALQSTISNLFAGLSLQMDRTVNVGDWIKIGERVGRVAEIKWRSTLVVTKDGDLVIHPNSTLIGSEVKNLSKPTLDHRVWVKIGFAYRHPPNEVCRVLLEAVRGVPGVLTQPPPDAFVVDFADSAITYALRYWINEYQRDTPIDGDVRSRIWYAAERAGLEIPYPIRTVYQHEVTDEQAERERTREAAVRTRALERTDLFKGLEEGDLEHLALSMRTARYSPGEIIIRQGDAGDSLYLVQQGEVTVKLSVDGAEREVAVIKAGQFFGEMSLMTGEPRRATCQARTEATCYVVDAKALSAVLESKPKVIEEISRVLGERQSALEGERENLSAEARARRAAENSSKLLRRIRDFFNLG